MKHILKPFFNPKVVEAGCDEAGRGCLSGAVFAGAVILPKDFKHEYLNDSKQISEKKRDQLRPIIEKEAITWGVGVVSPKEIDEINILNASFLAMHRAIAQLSKFEDSAVLHMKVLFSHLRVTASPLQRVSTSVFPNSHALRS